MNLPNLNNLAAIGKIQKESFSMTSLLVRLDQVKHRVNTAEKLLKNNDYNDEAVYISAYSELYNSFRILCEIMLAVGGYRTTNQPGHHETTLASIRLTLDDETLDPVYLRLIRIGKKRNGLEYGGKFDISSHEMAQMLADVQLVLVKVSQQVKINSR
ncbi:MAG: hypothetical protein V1765_02435 [bacterium]